MQNIIIIEKPYEFVPPHRGNWWPSFIQRFNLYHRYLHRRQGVVDYECRGVEHLRESLAAGHGILLTPNHCRPSDPIVMGYLAREAACHVFAMASWHLFMQDWFTRFAVHKMGGFSVNREGIDRQAINTAIGILTSAERPLIIFPEGAISRTNDVLHALLDGVSFIARTAAKKRGRHRPEGKVVVHPVAVKYRFQGDLQAALDPVLTEIETRLTWQPHHEVPLVERIIKVGIALLCVKEMEYFSEPQRGSLAERLQGLIDRLLCPLEQRWLGGPQQGVVVPRVKALRMGILPDMVQGRVSEKERRRRWQHLADIYLAQQVSCYLPDYITARPSVDRLLETVERYEEDLTDTVRVHGDLKVIIQVDEPIQVSPKRDRGAKVDPLMSQVESRLQSMLDKLALESPLFDQQPTPS